MNRIGIHGVWCCYYWGRTDRVIGGDKVEANMHWKGGWCISLCCCERCWSGYVSHIMVPTSKDPNGLTDLCFLESRSLSFSFLYRIWLWSGFREWDGLIDGNGGNWWFDRLLLFWVYLVGFDLLLIDGGGGFDHENVKFSWLLLVNLLLFWVWPAQLVYFIYLFIFLDLMEIRFGCWIWIWGLPEIGLVVGLFLRFGKNLKNMFLWKK